MRREMDDTQPLPVIRWPGQEPKKYSPEPGLRSLGMSLSGALQVAFICMDNCSGGGVVAQEMLEDALRTLADFAVMIRPR